MTNPIIQALANSDVAAIDAREFALGKIALADLKLAKPLPPDEARFALFAAWCDARGVRSLPARPSVIAFYILRTPMMDAATIDAISSMHRVNALADPTTAPEVTAAATRVHGKVPFPRSWPKTHWAAFEALPYALQLYLVHRDKEQTAAIKRAFNEAHAVKSTDAQPTETPAKTEHEAA